MHVMTGGVECAHIYKLPPVTGLAHYTCPLHTSTQGIADATEGSDQQEHLELATITGSHDEQHDG
jgi:hypothetical protein